MKCHYEVLSIPRDVGDEELKKAYRRLALKWHPDKNPHNAAEAKEQFQIIQQAYEVLSDPHERSWYDNHREAILKGGIGENYKDDSIDLFQYFTTSCFKGYGDDEKGFYTVYCRVFEMLATEDAEFGKEGDSDEDVPSFGDSKSFYEDVHNFYAYWQSYSTKRSFAWLDPYDIRDTPNRRVLRIVEKENKKVRDKAKRERNEQVRNLVAFIRKRDKRVQAHAQKLMEKAQENAKKAQDRKRQQLLERQRELKEHKVSEWSKFSNIESELKNIEANLAAEFGEELSDDDTDKDDEMENLNTMYCVVCNKIFKTHKAFSNHENSKKHRDNLVTMKTAMLKEDKDDCESSEQDLSGTKTKKVKLATGPEMADFLLNAPHNESKKDTDVTIEISDEELNSDDEQDSQKLINGNKNTGVKGLDDGYLFPEGSLKKNNDDDDETSPDELISDEEDEPYVTIAKKKKKKGKTIKKVNTEIDGEEEKFDLDMGLSKKQRRKKRTMDELMKRKDQPEVAGINNEEDEKEAAPNGNAVGPAEIDITPVPGKTKGKKAKKLQKAAKQQAAVSINVKVKRGTKNERKEVCDTELCCITCKSEFSSKNKLFDHLKKSGHSVYLPGVTKIKKSVGDKKNRGRAQSDSDSS